MADIENSKINGLFITGMLAILGTVAGGIINGCMDTKLEQQKLQSQLITKAFESGDQKQQLETLTFLINTNLISDIKLRNGVAAYIQKHEILSSLPSVSLKVHEFPFSDKEKFGTYDQKQANKYCKEKFYTLKKIRKFEFDANRIQHIWAHRSGKLCIANIKL